MFSDVAAVCFIFCFIGRVTCLHETNNSRNLEGEHKCEEPPCFLYAAELLIGLDKSVDPCENFYDYVCGQWEEHNFPDTNSILEEGSYEINRKIRAIFDRPINEEDVVLKKAEKFYNHCLEANKTVILQSVLKIMEDFGGWPILKGSVWEDVHRGEWFDDIFPLIAKLRRTFFKGGLFDVYVESKKTDNSKIIIELDQPSYSVSVKDEKKQKTELEMLISVLEVFMPEIGSKEGILTEAAAILELRDNIVKNLEELPEDLEKSFYITTVGALSKTTKIDWLRLFNLIFEGIRVVKEDDEIQIYGMKYFESLKWFVYSKRNSIRTIMNYELLYFYIEFLSRAVWSDNIPYTCAELVEECYDYVLSSKYASVYLHPKTLVEKVRQMTVNIFEAYNKRFDEIDWLDNTSRMNAKEKLKAMKDYFLYPAWTMNKTLVTEFYQDLSLGQNLIEDYVMCFQFSMNKQYQTLEHPSKFELWSNSPLNVNAYNSRNKNTINILEGLLQYPIFDEHLLQVMNYGSVGFIIGHEITHGFDALGIQFDKNGNEKRWLTEYSENIIKNKQQCLIDQYSHFELTTKELPGTNGFKVNGTVTLNENIADNGGIRQSFKAYKEWTKEFGNETLPDSLREFSNDQIFFMSFARTWCLNYDRSGKWIEILSEDPHSPAKVRIIVSLSNLEEFSEVFQCSKDSKMNLGEKRCIMW